MDKGIKSEQVEEHPEATRVTTQEALQGTEVPEDPEVLKILEIEAVNPEKVKEFKQTKVAETQVKVIVQIVLITYFWM